MHDGTPHWPQFVRGRSLRISNIFGFDRMEKSGAMFSRLSHVSLRNWTSLLTSLWAWALSRTLLIPSWCDLKKTLLAPSLQTSVGTPEMYSPLTTTTRTPGGLRAVHIELVVIDQHQTPLFARSREAALATLRSAGDIGNSPHKMISSAPMAPNEEAPWHQ